MKEKLHYLVKSLKDKLNKGEDAGFLISGKSGFVRVQIYIREVSVFGIEEITTKEYDVTLDKRNEQIKAKLYSREQLNEFLLKLNRDIENISKGDK